MPRGLLSRAAFERGWRWGCGRAKPACGAVRCNAGEAAAKRQRDAAPAPKAMALPLCPKRGCGGETRKVAAPCAATKGEPPMPRGL